jgi:predicted acylesterase/phospholipase RssA
MKLACRSGASMSLPGGGSLGTVRFGMMRSLVGHALNADVVVGSSVGAMAGAHSAGTVSRFYR